MASVVGFIGPACSSSARKVWNARFREQGREAVFECYPAATVTALELRLSEMMLHERRGYIVVGSSLCQEAALRMDDLDPSATATGSVDVIVNDGGVLTGYCLGLVGPGYSAAVDALWFPASL